ncbi:MAG: DUF4292 domain-containing protein [Bacteroidetes bacterium]|nr:DUF4292 domain-containing protein [Bacteroidota bacterium]
MPKLLTYMVIVILFAGTGCASRKKTITTITKPIAFDTISFKGVEANQLIDSIRFYGFNAQSYSLKADVKFVSDSGEQEFNANIRVLQDSAIWISINAILGIEVARVLITRDSLFLIDRLNKLYSKADYAMLNDLLRLRVDFNTMQNMLTGNFFEYRNENKFNSVYLEDKYYIVSTLNKRKLRRSLEDKDPNKPIVQDFYVEPLIYKILQLRIEDDKLKKTLQTDYKNFQQTDAGLFATEHYTQVHAEKNISLQISFHKVAVNLPIEIPFSIPESYSQMQK